MNVAPINRTLDQEILALCRAVSLECLVCGEFVLHSAGGIVCPECETRLDTVSSRAGLQFGLQTG